MIRLLKYLLVVFVSLSLSISGSISAKASAGATANLIKKLSGKNRSYGSYKEALGACQAGAYEDKDIVKVVVRKNLVYGKMLAETSELDLTSLRTIAGIALAKPTGSFNVIDFGGGGGQHYSVARLIVDSNVKINWAVVETNEMVSEAKQLENEELHFYSDLSVAAKEMKKIDLVYSSGALHCCESPLDELRKILELQAKYVFITRTAFLDSDETLINVQKSYLSTNGPGQLPSEFTDKTVYYPNVFVPRDKVESLILQNYQIRFKILEEKGTYRTNGNLINLYGYFCELLYDS